MSLGDFALAHASFCFSGSVYLLAGRLANLYRVFFRNCQECVYYLDSSSAEADPIDTIDAWGQGQVYVPPSLLATMGGNVELRARAPSLLSPTGAHLIRYTLSTHFGGDVINIYPIRAPKHAVVSRGDVGRARNQ